MSIKKPCSIICWPDISWSAKRGKRPSGVPTTSAPSGIQTIPRGGVGARVEACHGGAAASAPGVAVGTGRGGASRQPNAPTSQTRHASQLHRVALIPLSQAELLHLQLQTFSGD